MTSSGIAEERTRPPRSASLRRVLRGAGRRLLVAVPVLVALSVVVFLLLELTPGDPAAHIAGETATNEEIEAIRERLGLDRPIHVRYLDWASDAMSGDLGESLRLDRPVSTLIGDRLSPTLSIVFVTMVLALSWALPAGIAAALRPNGLLDRGLSTAASIAMAVPDFWLGLLLMFVFAVRLNWLPAVGYESISDGGVGGWLRGVLLPAGALAAAPAAELARQLRAGLRDALEQDYIRAAVAKGMNMRRVVLRHAAKNAAVPVITVFGLQVIRILGATIIVESVFSIPGLGGLLGGAVLAGDMPVVQGIALVLGVFVVALNFVVDSVNAAILPRAVDT